MQEENITVTVIIPVYNTARYLREAVDSVLNQTVPVAQIIVVDDGCPESIEAVLPDSNIIGPILKTGGNLGICVARNIGIRNAKGNWIAFLDADDIWRPDKIEKQIKSIRECEGAGLAFCDKENFWDDGLRPSWITRYDKQFDRTDPLGSLARGFFASPSTVMIRHDILRVCWGFQRDRVIRDQNFDDDYGLWMRVAAIASFAFVPEPLILYRRHNEQTTVRSSKLNFVLLQTRPLIQERWLLRSKIGVGRFKLTGLLMKRFCLNSLYQLAQKDVATSFTIAARGFRDVLQFFFLTPYAEPVREDVFSQAEVMQERQADREGMGAPLKGNL